MSVNEFLDNGRWSKGQNFLWEAHEQWLSSSVMEVVLPDDDKEVKHQVKALKRVVVWLMRYMNWQ